MSVRTAKMKVLVHSTRLNGSTVRLMDRLLSMVSEKQMYCTIEIENFRGALLKYRTDRPIVVIHVGSMAGLAQIKDLDDILDDLFLIILTETDSKEMLMSCRRLYPRLLIDSNEDFWIVTAVIEKRLASLD